MADPITDLIALILAGNFAVLLIFLGIIIIVTWLLGALFLMVGLSVVNGKHRELGTVMITVLLGAILGWIPCLGCVLYWYFIKLRHETSWGGAIVAWILAGLIPLVIILFVGWIFLLPILLGP